MGIYIDTPCSEDWDKMTPTEKGAFCQKCALEVYDFSGKTPSEIKSILAKEQSGNVCGRILPSTLDQLNADFIKWERTNSRSFQSMLIFSLIVAFGFSLFSCTEEEKQHFGEIHSVGQSLMQLESPTTVEQTESLEFVLNPEIAPIKSVQSRAQLIETVEIQVCTELPEEHVKGAMRFEPFEDEMTPIMLGGVGFSDAYLEHIREEQPTNNEINAPAFSSKLFPNPANEYTQLEVSLPEDIAAQVKLFNLAGELVREVYSGVLTKGTQKIDVNISGLKEGIYLVTIQSPAYSSSLKLRKF